MKRGKTRESSAAAAKKKPKRTIENPGKLSSNQNLSMEFSTTLLCNQIYIVLTF